MVHLDAVNKGVRPGRQVLYLYGHWALKDLRNCPVNVTLVSVSVIVNDCMLDEQGGGKAIAVRRQNLLG